MFRVSETQEKEEPDLEKEGSMSYVTSVSFRL